jgi:hypothetical protein
MLARTASTLHTLWPMPPLLPVTTASFAAAMLAFPRR